jgi:DNA-binding NarL/FixJ family response regulator
LKHAQSPSLVVEIESNDAQIKIFLSDKGIGFNTTELNQKKTMSLGMKTLHERVFTATNGTQALSIINEEKPDIAILDMEMPHLTGLQIAQLCQQNKSTTKIVFLTYRLDSYLFNKGIEAGIVGYLLKDDAMVEVQRCIMHVAKGETYFSKKIMELPEDAPEDVQNYQLLSPPRFEGFVILH